jgi:hypothetical protein
METIKSWKQAKGSDMASITETRVRSEELELSRAIILNGGEISTYHGSLATEITRESGIIVHRFSSFAPNKTDTG